MKLNHYLEELGFTWNDLPGNYDPDLCDTDPAAADPRNEEDEEGFCTREFFNLDFTLALYIYPRLCYFREYCAEVGTPAYFCYDEEGNHIDNGDVLWKETLDKMILAFRYMLTPDVNINEKEISQAVDEGLALFAEFYHFLWY